MKTDHLKNDHKPEDHIFRPRTRKELAVLYGYSDRIMKIKLSYIEKIIGKKVGWYYDPIQVELIFIHLGIPPGLGVNRFDKTEDHSGITDWPKQRKHTDD